MKICLFSPYIPKHFGGGEKYMFQVAIALANKYQVFIAIPHKQELTDPEKIQIKNKYQLFLNDSLQNVDFISTPLKTDESFLRKLVWTKQFDLIYYLTDGSLFFSLAKKNILHIQFPFTNLRLSLLDKLKLITWQVINANSSFTKEVVEKRWGIRINFIHYPAAIPSDVFQQYQKEKIILSVGRFFKHLNSKRQDVLIRIFQEMRRAYPKSMDGWKLVLVGGVEDQEYLKELKTLSVQDPAISIQTNARREQLEALYRHASIYWHAAGFEIDELNQPEKVEHFGISTVEAMAAGCVPVVHNKGGQTEIMTGNLQSLCWQTTDECEKITIDLIKNQQKLYEFSQLAIKRAKDFSQNNFEEKLWKMVG
ncbi:MAG: glycosyltransferase family 4 protein [Patescibacteria group bacterium]